MATTNLVLQTDSTAEAMEGLIQAKASSRATTVRGWFRVLFLYDVAEAIRLDQVRSILGAQPGWRKPSLTRPVPDYVRLEPAPAVEPIDEVALETAERLKGRINYYEYGVVSVELVREFACTWEQLVGLASAWIGDQRLEMQSVNLAKRRLERATTALVKPTENWLSEDYFVVQLCETEDPDGGSAIASELLARHGHEISQVVRGESAALSGAEQEEILQSNTSYTPTDLLVVGWTGALVYDTTEGAVDTIQLLEYANTQLLEFRYYDNLLTRVLKGVYAALERKRVSSRAGGWREKRSD